jgi:hypothetical protein
MKAVTQDIGMNLQVFTQEPKSIGSIARLMECPSIGRSVRQTWSLVTNSLSLLLSENIRVFVTTADRPMNYTEP